VEDGGKRVSWVELYLDLVFVLAVGHLAHLIVEEPEMSSVWIALGLFFALWWTWVGFAVLYNRHGVDRPANRLLFLAGSIPAGVAAVAIEPASTGDSTVFALSLGVIRLLLVAAYAVGDGGNVLRERNARACLVSAALFVISAAVREPVRYVLWAVAIGIESGTTLSEDREAARRMRRDHDVTALRPADPAEALDPHHFAERFGLFLIILLGEVLVEAGQAPVDTTAGWLAVAAAMALAAALWWIYFDSAADINMKVLELSGGSPTIARAIFAVGHMLPSFALLITGAGIGLLFEEDPPHIAYWLACVGIGIYLASTRAVLAWRRRIPGIVAVLLLVATFQLARLGPSLEPHGYVLLLAGWTIMCAMLSTRTAPLEDAELERYLAGDREG
jgi:low temperature requirement protein LtrA